MFSEGTDLWFIPTIKGICEDLLLTAQTSEMETDLYGLAQATRLGVPVQIRGIRRAS